MKNIIATAFGIGAMISLFMIYRQNERKKLIFCKLCADVCWVIHYICLGAFGGAVPNFVGIFRECVFSKREEKQWADKPVWPVLFISLNLVLGILSFNSYINILPLTASAFVTVSLWCRKPKLTKIISFPVSLTFLIYDFFVCSYIGMINETAALISIIISFIEEKKDHTKKETENE